MPWFYTRYDFIWLSICVVVCVVIGAILMNLKRFENPWIRRIPFIVIVVALFIGEIVKQIQSFGFRGDFYRIHSLPFFICSSLFIWYAMACFCPPKSRAAQIGMMMSHCMSICITVGVLVAPKIILYTYTTMVATEMPNFFVWHSLFFHFIIMLWATLSLFLRAYTPDKRDIKWIFILFAAFMIIPTIATIALNNDFAGFGKTLSFITFEWLRITSIAIIYTVVITTLSALVLIWLPLRIIKREVS